MLLFSYNRNPRWKKLDALIAPTAMILIVLLFMEASRLVIGQLLKSHPIDLNQIDEWLQIIRSVVHLS